MIENLYKILNIQNLSNNCNSPRMQVYWELLGTGNHARGFS